MDYVHEHLLGNLSKMNTTKSPFMISQHLFKLFGTVWQQAIAWHNGDPGTRRDLASQGHN